SSSLHPTLLRHAAPFFAILLLTPPRSTLFPYTTLFRSAFDEIPKDRQKSELDWLIENKVTRILTHGGLEGTVFDNLSWLKELVEHAAGRIEILVGGGVTYENWPQLAESLSTDQFHGTKIVPLESIQ